MTRSDLWTKHLGESRFGLGHDFWSKGDFEIFPFQKESNCIRLLVWPVCEGGYP